MPKTEEQCQQSREDTRNRILKESSLYFARNGFGDTKIGDLAKHIGIGQGTIYLYFKSKEELFEEIRKSAVYGKVKDIIAFIGKDKKQQALFEEQINQDLDNIVVRLKEDLGKVSDEDARFICYTIAGFDPNMIATLLNLSLSNVYTKRSRLRDRIRQLNSPYKEEYLRVL